MVKPSRRARRSLRLKGRLKPRKEQYPKYQPQARRVLEKRGALSRADLEAFVASYSRISQEGGPRIHFRKQRRANLEEVARRLGVSGSTLRRKLSEEEPVFARWQRKIVSRRVAYASKRYAWQFLARVNYQDAISEKRKTRWVTTKFFLNVHDRAKAETDLLSEVVRNYPDGRIVGGSVALQRRRFG